MFRSLVTLLQQRWQIPLAIVASATAAIVLHQIRPPEPALHFQAILADLHRLRETGATLDAADAAANFLGHDPPLPAEHRAALHGFLADLIYDQESRAAIPNAESAELFRRNLQAAHELGRPRTLQDELRIADALRWSNHVKESADAYRELLAKDPAPVMRRDALRSLVLSLGDARDSGEERRRCIDALLNDPDAGTETVWWAMQQAMRDALDRHDTIRGRELLSRHGDRLKTSDLKGYLTYLEAWVLVNEGRTDAAAPLVEWVSDWLDTQSLRDARLDALGHLPAMNRWLLGRIHLAEDRPQAALSSFDDALSFTPGGEMSVAIEVGRGRALAGLARHDEAIQAFGAAVKGIHPSDSLRPRAVQEFSTALQDLFDELFAKGDYNSALGYLELASHIMPTDDAQPLIRLLDRLGRAGLQAAEKTADTQLRSRYLSMVGDALLRAHDLQKFDDVHSGWLLWTAAWAYDRAGRNADARRLLERFIDGRSMDARLPEALLQLGQVCEAVGDREAALKQYAELINSYPRLEEAARARVFSARALLALGEDYVAEAEKLLLGLLGDDVVSPEANVFYEALLELCDLLYESGRYAEAIGRLENLIELYPSAPDLLRAQFILADAYRLSAYGLRANQSPETPNPVLQAEIHARFDRAVDQYDRVLAAAPASPPTKARDLYERLALLYEADCLFERNESAHLQRAITLYRQAAVQYENTPTALTALVQLANVHLRLGDPAEAARAVERARWMVRSIPDAAFLDSDDGVDRAGWEKYLAVLTDSHLFQEVYAAAP